MVPDGWETRNFDELFRVRSGVGFKYAEYVEKGIPLVKIDNVSHGYVKWENTSYLPENYSDQYPDIVLKEGDILLALNRPITQGKLKIARVTESDTPSILYQRVGKIEFLTEKADPGFYYQYLDGVIYKFVARKSIGSDQPFISIRDLGKVNVCFPPIGEQKKIAKILSTWDKAIATVEKLITNSQQQKKALMQQLLTGRKRLPGFGGKWKDKYLTDIAEVIVSPVDKKSVDGEVPVELCNYTDVYYNSYITRDIEFMKVTATTSEINKFTLQVGDVIITKDSETPGDIAVPAVVAEELEGVLCGYHLAMIRPKIKVSDGGYLNFLFSMPKTRYYFFTLATGATRFGLSVGGINKAHFTLPPYDEQKAISCVLRSADKEVALLKSQLEKFKGEKKAMMQQLLTGKRRVAL